MSFEKSKIEPHAAAEPTLIEQQMIIPFLHFDLFCFTIARMYVPLSLCGTLVGGSLREKFKPFGVHVTPDLIMEMKGFTQPHPQHQYSDDATELLFQSMMQIRQARCTPKPCGGLGKKPISGPQNDFRPLQWTEKKRISSENFDQPKVPWTTKRTNESILDDLRKKLTLKSKFRKQQANFYGHGMRRQELDNLITTARV